MQLNELLERHSIGTISEKTMISEDNIKHMVSEDFSALSKAKALGFLSILEREYHVDVKNIKKNIIEYYSTIQCDDKIVNITHTIVEEKKGRSKWFLFLMITLLAYASWYFFTQFDKKTLNTLMPFSEDKNIDSLVEDNKSFEISKTIIENTAKVEKKEEIVVKVKEVAQNNNSVNDDSLVLETVLSSTQKDAAGVESNIIVMDIVPSTNSTVSANATSLLDTQLVSEVNLSSIDNNLTQSKIEKNAIAKVNQSEIQDEAVAIESTKVILKPVKRLWFGLVNMRTGKRDHFSIRKAFTIDLTKDNWLVATSAAPFSFIFKNKIDTYKNGREHYFVISKEGITSLKKRAYVKKGGYRKW